MKSYALSLRIPMASEDVFRELGHLIIARLALRDIALGAFAVDHTLRDLSRARVGEVWAKLSPLLVQPFYFSKHDLLNRRTFFPRDGPIGADARSALVSALGVGALPLLTILFLCSADFGFAGMLEFASAIKPNPENPAGALASLRELELCCCQIGDAGLVVFA